MGSTGVTTLLIGVITPFITGRDQFCMDVKLLLLSFATVKSFGGHRVCCKNCDLLTQLSIQPGLNYNTLPHQIWFNPDGISSIFSLKLFVSSPQEVTLNHISHLEDGKNGLKTISTFLVKIDDTAVER